MQTIVSRLIVVLAFFSLSSAAFGETCADVAQRAYDSAYRQCVDNGPQCRVDADCGFGMRCNVGRCVQAPNPLDCVRNCTDRRSDGTCRTYGADFCGRNPNCVENCTDRRSDGSCRTYGGDICVEGSYSCVLNCVDRRSDGTCRTYGADHCATWASCTENCIDRRSDGTCRTYGPDRCN